MQVSAVLYNFLSGHYNPVFCMENLSNCCRHKSDPSISRIFLIYFWRVFAIWPNFGVVSHFHSAWGKSTVSHCLVKWRWCTSSIMSHTLLLGRSKFEIVKVSKRVKSTLWFWDLKYFGTLVVCRYRLLWYLVCYPICTLLSAIFD